MGRGEESEDTVYYTAQPDLGLSRNLALGYVTHMATK